MGLCGSAKNRRSRTSDGSDNGQNVHSTVPTNNSSHCTDANETMNNSIDEIEYQKHEKSAKKMQRKQEEEKMMDAAVPFQADAILVSGTPMSEDDENEWRQNHGYIDIEHLYLDDRELNNNASDFQVSHFDGQAMNEIENELNEMNRWIRLLHGIDYLCKLTKHRVYQHICVEIASVSVEELRMNNMAGIGIHSACDHDRKVLVDILIDASFAGYPPIS